MRRDTKWGRAHVCAAALLGILFPAAWVCGMEACDKPSLGEILAPDEYGNVIPDFSNAGYMGGGVPLPDVPVVLELHPKPGGGDRERIQEALDEIGRMEPGEDGFRGALLLRAGEYRVHGHLHIKHGGVVLRGEGQFPGGTSITATRKDYKLEGQRRQHSLIYLGTTEISRTGLFRKGVETVMSGGIVPVGGKAIPVKSVQGFKAGDGIVIEIYPNEKWLETLGLEKPWEPWGRGTYTRFIYERKIAGIEDRRLILDVPMTFYLDEDNFHRVAIWNFSGDGRISKSGVENLRLKSYYNDGNYDNPENFRLAGETDRRHARNGVRIAGARDSWVRDVTALHFHHAAVLVCLGARNITVQDCAYLRPVSRVDGGRRYPFRVDGTNVLVQRCYAREGSHSFGSSSVAPGPNVFLDCLAEKSFSCSGPHIKWATGFLYDNVAAPHSAIEVRKQRVESAHGWRGVNHVLWNCSAALVICDEPETRDTNWSIGSIAHKRPSPNWKLEFGKWVSHGSHVAPRSLYLRQLENRLGKDALSKITTPLQREKDGAKIHSYLKDRFAELTEQELANDENIILDPGFRIIAGRAWWEITGGASDISAADLERARNPLYPDDSAIILPPGYTLRTKRFIFGMDISDDSPSEYLFRFDYKFEGKEPPGVSITYMPIEYERNWGDTVNLELGRPEITSLPEGNDRWRRVIYRFEIDPGRDEKGIPYPPLLRIAFSSSEQEHTVANPFFQAG